MITPRDYQGDARDALWAYFEEFSGNPLVLMPTGTGKSIVIGDFCRSALFAWPHTRIMAITHVETLIKQNYEKLLALWPAAPAGIYSAGLNRRDTIQQIIFAGIQSVYDKPGLFPWVDLLIIDEAHLVSPKDETMYQTFIDALKAVNPQLKVIGLTATAWRLGLGSLVGNGIFTDVAIDMTTPAAWNYFVDQGYLAPLHSKKTVLRLDDTNIKVVGGEYSDASQQREIDKEDLTRQAVEELIYWGNAENRNCWMLFATGVKHCEHVAEMLDSYGIPAVAIHSKAKNAADRLAAFKAGEYRAAVSMNKLTTGVDVEQIDLMGVLRFTKSSALWVQMLGRGTRPAYAPGYDLRTAEGRHAAIAAGPKPSGCRVCDFAHNTERLGPINNPVVSSPKGAKKKSSQGAPVRVCPACAEYVHASHRSCPECGYEFGMVIRIEGTSSDAEVMTREPQPEPRVILVDIDRVTYHYHQRRASTKPPTLRVSYYTTGEVPQKHEEWIAFEHEGTARTRAENWWRERLPLEWPSSTPAPQTIQQALEWTSYLQIPKRLKVWVNPPNGRPRIQGYEYATGRTTVA